MVLGFRLSYTSFGCACQSLIDNIIYKWLCDGDKDVGLKYYSAVDLILFVILRYAQKITGATKVKNNFVLCYIDWLHLDGGCWY